MVAIELLPERDCETCTTAKQNRWGCAGADAGQPPDYPVLFEREPIMRCPRRPILDDPDGIGEVLWSWQDRGKGYLPNPGGMGDQPAKLVQAWRVVDNVTSKTRDAKLEQVRSRAETKSHGRQIRR